MRIFTQDIGWQAEIAKDPTLAKGFQLDFLINSEDVPNRKVGISMGVLLMMKLSKLQLEDFVDEDYSMIKINQAMTRFYTSYQTRSEREIQFEERVKEIEH